MLKEYNGMQIDKVNWLTSGSTLIGMIQITNSTGDKKVYVGAIGVASNADVGPEESDIKRILSWGAPMNPETAENLHNHLKGN